VLQRTGWALPRPPFFFQFFSLTNFRDKAKVKLSLCLIMQHVIKDIWGSGGTAPPFLTSASDGGKWSLQAPATLALGTHWIRTGMKTVKKNLCPCRGSKTGHPARSPSLYRLPLTSMADLRTDNVHANVHKTIKASSANYQSQ
jgi:hypothetical protein